MKYALIIAAFMLSFAHAEAPTVYKQFKVDDPATGILNVTILDYGLPVEPYLMTMTITCYDKRAKPNVVHPSEEILIRNKPLCDFDRYEFDNREKLVTIHYSVSEPAPGPAQCNGHFRQPFDLRTICSKWQP